jgi:SAM-dependent methyltransferase
MTREQAIIELGEWLKSPAGRYLLDWEQAQIDREVADVFGFHALQLGLPELDALRANRMPHRWLAHDSLTVPEPLPMPEPADSRISTQPANTGVALHCDFDALPFPSNSLDLLVLPHALELARDPHLTLREVERVLVPEGRVIIVGFNPASLWGLRQRMGRARSSMGLSQGGLYLPRAGEFIGYWRLRDWLRLLSFEVERGRFGCWRPPVTTQRWLDRYAWMERAGDRWWPVFGALYLLVAVKRVRGMRLVGLARREALQPKAAPAVVANRRPRPVAQAAAHEKKQQR